MTGQGSPAEDQPFADPSALTIANCATGESGFFDLPHSQWATLENNYLSCQTPMMIQRLVQRVLETQVLTSAIENQISQLLWQREYDGDDLAALGELLDALEAKKIQTQQ
ncbi:hypothetical protein [Thermosynechococcus sp.]|uniref:hypothetical protein n=1 Tax=Thermosynechococcus sp. TaxID=2814275 RepID=UPI0026225FE9|nr:hypothetical protein [Thermosynechococcus sp.]